MSDQFVGEIRAVGFNFAPQGWALCNGQILPISQNTALFSLLGTQYGGNGQTTFALPNLQGRAPLDQGSGPGLTPRSDGDTGGESGVTLNVNQLPSHTHTAGGSTAAGNQAGPGGNVWGVASARRGLAMYDTTPGLNMSAQALAMAGSSSPHNNLPPFLVLNFIIALTGIFPARS